jgi:hypothetical protein
MRSAEEVKAHVLDIVTRATNRRIRPITLERMVMRETGASMQEVKHCLNDLMREKKLVFTYRDPCSYVEIPTPGSHLPA